MRRLLRNTAMNKEVSGDNSTPEDRNILDKWNQAGEEEYRKALIEDWGKDTLLDLDKLGEKKAKRLKYALGEIGGAVLLLSLDKILGVSIPVLEKFCLHV